MIENHCPQTGKIYIIILLSIIVSILLIAISSNYNKNEKHLYNVGIVVNILQIIFTFYLLSIDIFYRCKTDSKCSVNCKWNDIMPFTKKCEKNNSIISISYLYIIIIGISAAYLIAYGFDQYNKYTNEEKGNKMLFIPSIILGFISILLILTDILFFCMCKYF